MTAVEQDADRALKARHRAMWASGDYPAVAAELIPALGPELVAACGVAAGQRCSTSAPAPGNAAIPAARTGATVTASDLTPELFEVGRRDAAARGRRAGLGGGRRGGAALRRRRVRRRAVLRRGDVRASPPGDGGRADPGLPAGRDHRHDQLDAGGVHRATSSRPWVRSRPRRPRRPDHRRCGAARNTCASSSATGSPRWTCGGSRSSSTAAPTPLEFREYWKRNYGPTIAVYGFNAGEPERVAALDAAFLEFLSSWDRGGRYEAEYLLLTARKR